MKEGIQRDVDHLYALLDQCKNEDILQQIRKNNIRETVWNAVKTVLNLC